MKLAIFGATGTAGSALLDQALDAGHEVTALARTPAKLTKRTDRFSVVEGDVKDCDSVRRTVAGADAVLSALGATDKHDRDLRRAGTANIIAAMHEAAVQRLVVLGGFHLPCQGGPNNLGRKLIVPIIKLMGIVVEDTLAMAALVEGSGLDWTLVRIPRIARSAAPDHPEVGILRLGPWNKVSRATTASFMLECVTDGVYIHQAPMVCDRTRAHQAEHGLAPATDAGITGTATAGDR